MHRILLTAAIAVLAALTSSAAAQTSAPVQSARIAEQAESVLIGLSQMEELGSRCAWLSPVGLQAIRSSKSTTWERLTGKLDDDEMSALRSTVERNAGEARILPCTGPRGERLKVWVVQAGAQMTRNWVIIAEGILAASKAPWATNLTTLEAQAGAVEAAVDALRKQDADQLARLRAQAEAEALGQLKLVCIRRRPRQSTAASACPVVSASFDERYHADRMLLHAENFGRALAADTLGRPR